MPIKHVLLDVDGVLLNFTRMMVERCRERGLPTPTDVQIHNRRHEMLYDSFPKMFPYEMERALVTELLADKEAMRNQPCYPEIDYRALGQLVQKYDIGFLTKIPSHSEIPRIERLEELLGVPVWQNFHTVWGDMSKGRKMREICEGRGWDPRETLLIDDNVDNVRSALSHGCLAATSRHIHNVSTYIPCPRWYGFFGPANLVRDLGILLNQNRYE